MERLIVWAEHIEGFVLAGVLAFALQAFQKP